MQVRCPQCHAEGRFPPEKAGKTARCPRCQHRFLVVPPLPSAPADVAEQQPEAVKAPAKRPVRVDDLQFYLVEESPLFVIGGLLGAPLGIYIGLITPGRGSLFAFFWIFLFLGVGAAYLVGVYVIAPVWWWLCYSRKK
jgi:DNA-directed RNA polymerase subunit RPC12/RpoP